MPWLSRRTSPRRIEDVRFFVNPRHWLIWPCSVVFIGVYNKCVILHSKWVTSNAASCRWGFLIHTQSRCTVNLTSEANKYLMPHILFMNVQNDHSGARNPFCQFSERGVTLAFRPTGLSYALHNAKPLKNVSGVSTSAGISNPSRTPNREEYRWLRSGDLSGQ